MDEVAGYLRAYATLPVDLNPCGDRLKKEEQVARALLRRLEGLTKEEITALREQQLSSNPKFFSYELSRMLQWLLDRATRADARTKAPGERVEALLRLDRYLLSPAALRDQRKVVEIEVRFTPSGAPLHLTDVGSESTPLRPKVLTFGSVARLAADYRKGYAIDTVLGYERSPRKFVVEDPTLTNHLRRLPVTELADPVRDLFARVIVVTPLRRPL